MELPALPPELGRVTAVERLFDYGYRAAWTVTAEDRSFLVKSDSRPGMAERERAAHAHARAGGVPVAQLVAWLEEPAPSLVLEWLGDVVSLSELDHPGAWRAAGETLRKLHDLPVLRRRDEAFPAFMRGWFERELRQLVASAAVSDSDATAALAKARQFDDTVARTVLVWAHVDCQAAHFLMSAGDHSVAAVIDWADACEDAPDMDFAVMTLFERRHLDELLDGYGASDEMRERLAVTLPFYRAVRAAGAYNWLETHGYPGHTWPLEEIRAFIA